jgi:REP element-mobilizing transposase RayT
MGVAAFCMDDAVQRATVLASIRQVCEQRGWWLFAAHVRVNHVHVVVQAGDPPEKVMNDFKVYASRRLNLIELDASPRKRWARHGSTRYIWTQEQLDRAIHYVLHEQGEPMAIQAAPGLCTTKPSEPRA